MTLKADQQQVKALLTETIMLLCKNGLHFRSEFCVEGLIGITLDRDEVFLINIKEIVRCDQLSNAAGSRVADNPDASEAQDQEKQPDLQEMSNPPNTSKPEENGRQSGADGMPAPSVTDGHNLVQAVVQSLSLPVSKYQRSRSTVPFHTFEDLLPQNNSDLLRANDEYDLSLLAHSACVYGQQEGKLSMKLQSVEVGKKPCDEYSGVFAEDFSRHIENEKQMNGGGVGQMTEGVASTSALQKEGQMTTERPAKRQRLDGAEATVAGLECGLLESIASGCSDGNMLSTDQKVSTDIVNIKEEPSLESLSLAYSALQAGHFDLEGGQNFPFTSSQRHATGNPSSALVPGCSILDGSGLDLQSQATRLAMLHLQLPTRRYSIAGKMFHCLACGKALSSLHNLKLHEATVHRGLFQYRCPLCGKGLRQERDLRGHLANRHNMKKDFRCSICGNEFGYKRNLKQHMVSYHGWKDAVVQLPL